jgi:hypothetical protein
MRPPHARIAFVAAVCGLAVAAGAGGAAPVAGGGSPGPVAAFGFGEGGGARLADASGHANHGSTTARRTEAGRFGRALRMNGPSEAARVPDDASLRLRRAMTLEAWVRPDPGRGSRAILVKEADGRVAYALGTSRGRPQALVHAGRGTHRARAVAPLSPGRWTHLAATYDGRSVRLLVDGAEIARTPASGRLLAARGPLRIGAGGVGGDRFRGRIDEVRVYGRALGRKEIAADMRRPVRSDRGRSTRPVIVKPAPAPPASPPPGSPRDGAGRLQWGYVANADIINALDSTRSAHGRLARVEFEIGASTGEIRPYVEAAAARGIEVLLLAGFHGTMPSAAEARNLGEWARTFGPGGTFWSGRADAQLASRFIEFGNESSYSYQGTQGRGGEYALRFADAYGAIQAANPRVGLLAQADDANISARWVNDMFDAVPGLASMVAGWTIHPYGPEDRWKPRIDRLIAQTAARGAPSDIPIDITEWGLATDDGRQLNDNYGWPTAMTYQQAAQAVNTTVARMLATAPLASRLRIFTYFQGHDQKPSGTGEREHYFGVLRNDGSDKGPLTAALRAVADAHPAH